MRFRILTAQTLLGIALTIVMICGGWIPVSARHASGSLPVLHWNGLGEVASWPPTLDPADVSDNTSSGILIMTDANFVKFLPNGKIVPDLATWKVSKNHRVYTFTIRSNARFADGNPVTAQDAAYSLTRALAKSTPSSTAIQNLGHIVGATKWNAGKARGLQGVKVLNARQIQIFLDKPIAFFLGALTAPTGDIIEKKVNVGHPAQTYLTQTCRAQRGGAGPFTFKCLNNLTGFSSFYHSGSTPQITLVPNRFYYGHKPHIIVNMRALPTLDAEYRTYQANGLDVTSIPTADIARDRGKPGFVEFPSFQMWYLSPDPKVKPFDNVHCRLAVAYAINYDAIANQILHGSRIAIHSMVPTNVRGYYNGAGAPTYDPSEAKKELSQCPGGIHNVKIAYLHTESDWDNVYGAAIPAMMSAVGIDMKGQGLTFNDWLKDVTQPQSKTGTAIAQNGLIAFADPWNYCTLLLRGGEPFNSGEYNNPVVNRLLDRADVESNPSKRAQLYIQAQKIAIGEAGVIPLFEDKYFEETRPWVHGLVPSAVYSGLTARNEDWSNVSISHH